jgi:hypothetical protein
MPVSDVVRALPNLPALARPSIEYEPDDSKHPAWCVIDAAATLEEQRIA